MKLTALFSLALLSTFVQGATLTVTTVDNNNTTAGQLSLKQAITQAGAGDTIRFNIAGAGPHEILTPDDGYPMITADNVTIDGYSQPGATPNTNPILGTNNANLKIVIDSSEVVAPGGRFLLAPLNNPGFGDNESTVFAISGKNFKAKGLSIRLRQTDGNATDPYIYAFALINAATGAHISGCWFGVDPDGVTVHGGRASVANFKGDGGAEATGLVLGTNGDGVDDRAEFNVHCGIGIPAHLETRDVRLSGNFFNVFPDGKTFVEGEPGESIENGDGANMIIGTNGDGVSDENERNIFGRIPYDTVVEFWRSGATNVIFAGNYVGVNVDKSATIANGTTLIAIRKQSSARIGSNGDGISDDIEANQFYGMTSGTFLDWHGSNGDAGGVDAAKVVVRGNVFSGNAFGTIPFIDGAPIPYAAYYNSYLQDAASVSAFGPTFTNKGTTLAGIFPARNMTDYPSAVVDFYLADPVAMAAGSLHPSTWLGSLWDNSASDADPAVNQFSWHIPNPAAVNGGTIIAAVTYSKDANKTEVARAVTSPLAASVDQFAISGISTTAGTMTLNWIGGSGKFLVQKNIDLNTTNWMNLLTTTERTATVARDGAAGYFRVVDNYTGADVTPLTAYLSPNAEVPAVTSSTGSGTATLSLEGNKLSWLVYYQGLSSSATLGHIHGFFDTQNSGGVKQGFPNPSGTSGTIFGNATVTEDIRTNILNGKTYVNIHTVNNGSGEIRGQILRTKYVATLNGANEKPTAVTTAGTGTATINLIGNEMRYNISFTGLGSNAQQAHIHGRADVNNFAGVLQGFSGVPVATSGTISGILTADTATRSAIVDGLAYVNIHSVNNGGGEIRGQLVPEVVP